MKYYNYLYLLLLVMTSCYDRVEGCLDTYAENYNVTADDDCNGCCTFPSLNVKISHMLGDSVYRSTDTLTNDLGQTYVIEDVRFYMSELLTYQEGKPLNIIRHIGTEDNKVIIPDDMKIVRSVDANISFGTIRAYGDFDSLTFRYGLSDLMLTTSFVSLPTNHVLLPLNKLKNKSDIQAFLTMKYKRISPVKDSIVQSLAVIEKPNLPLYTIRKNVKTSIGNPIIFSLKTDYKVLFQNLDVTLSSDSLSKLIIPNIPKMIRVD